MIAIFPLITLLLHILKYVNVFSPVSSDDLFSHLVNRQNKFHCAHLPNKKIKLLYSFYYIYVSTSPVKIMSYMSVVSCIIYFFIPRS